MDHNALILNLLQQQSNRGQQGGQPVQNLQVQQQPTYQLGLGLTNTATTQANTTTGTSVGSTQNNDLQALLVGILSGANSTTTSPPAVAAPPQSVTQQILGQPIEAQLQQQQQQQSPTQQLLVQQLLQASQPQPAAAQVLQQQPSLPGQVAQVQQQQQAQQPLPTSQHQLLARQLLSGQQGLLGNPTPTLTQAAPTAATALPQVVQQAATSQNNNVQVNGNLLLGIVQALSQLHGNNTTNTVLGGPHHAAAPLPHQPVNLTAANNLSPPSQVADPPAAAAAAASAILPPSQQPSTGSNTAVIAGGGGVAVPTAAAATTATTTKTSSVKKQSKKNKAPASTATRTTASAVARPAKRSKYEHSHLIDNSNTRSALLYVPSDDDSISPYAAYARQQIEFFEAQEVDVKTGAQGRNKPVKIGQVGLRCIHCKHLHPKLRTRGAVYYPSRLGVLYQAAQNTVKTHLPELCESMTEDIRNKLLSLNTKRSSVGGGKHYWSAAAQIQGVIDTEDGLFFQKQDK